jgi:hypothetical protein
LQSTGLTAIHKTLGVLIVEAKEGAAGEGSHSVARIKDLEIGLGLRIKRQAQRWCIRVDVEGVSKQVARELILDRCMVCQGRGVIPMRYDGSRMVAVSNDQEGANDVECTECLGSASARREYKQRAQAAGFEEYTVRLGEWWESLLQSCADAEADARRAVWRRLKAKH